MITSASKKAQEPHYDKLQPSTLITLLSFGTLAMTAWMPFIDLLTLFLVFSSKHLRNALFNRITFRKKNDD